uniref:Protein kinase domain-containing protein n=1 Tax=Macrostomum lignano TaxID=282301 RepID=A0A1I8FCR4_9PLAT
LKFLHSANILPPGHQARQSAAVNSDCKLKICDFGLARVRHRPQLSGGQVPHPGAWLLNIIERLNCSWVLKNTLPPSTFGLPVASLPNCLVESILFQASNPLSQLDLIMDLLGTPDLSDLTSACTAARRYILRLPKASAEVGHHNLVDVAQTVTEDALHLLEHMLMFNPKQRSTAASALSHPYLDEARLRYHSCMCTCCPRPASSAYQHQRHACLQHQPHLMQQHHPEPLDPRNRTMPLLLNRQAVNFRAISQIQASPRPRDAAITAIAGQQRLRNIVKYAFIIHQPCNLLFVLCCCYKNLPATW